MSTRLFLVRHAESTWNAEGRVQGQADPPLSEAGRAQAARLADRFRGDSIVALYASPLQRARQTADVVAGAVGLPIQFDDRLKEHNMGLFTGLVWMDIVQQFPEFAQAWMEQAMDVPAGEKQHIVRARAADAVDDILARHAEGRIVIVSHGGILGEYLAHALGLELARRHPFRFDNASVSEVELHGPLFRIHHLNDVSHLLSAASPAALSHTHAADDSPMDEDTLSEADHANDHAGV